MNVPAPDLLNECRDTQVTIPVLDDPISHAEISAQITKINANKACGPDGIAPCVFNMLPDQWIMLITSLFNAIFSTVQYPTCWNRAKLFTIFKSRDRKNAKNYRGISITNSISKLFDMVLCARLDHWFKPHREQAGIEHIVTLRLLTDFARRKRKKLFVTFIDFSKAYDLVPRHILIRILTRLRCGLVMLGIICAMYNATESISGTAVFVSTVGVRQCSPTSFLLFIIYVNNSVKLVKDNCNDDGFFDVSTHLGFHG